MHLYIQIYEPTHINALSMQYYVMWNNACDLKFIYSTKSYIFNQRIYFVTMSIN